MSHPVIVIGTGPVGIRFVKELLKADPLQSIIIFGNEPWQPYNRVKLSALLAADIQIDQIDNHEWQTISQHPNVTAHHNCHIKSINRDEKVIVDEFGEHYLYSNLILAVGSRPYLPNIPGIEMRGVYTFRDMTDVQALIARQVSSRKVCVIGGGLLGLETAKALARHNTEVILLQRSPHIMNNQLDAECAAILAERIKQQAITIRCGEGVVSIQGDDKVTGLTLRDGETIECDTIVVSAGIIPNKEIAFNAELPVGRGIKVNDRLQTSDPHIYAIGECAEHDGQTYGLVSPGFEQAAIAARVIADENNSTENNAALYIGSTTATELKVVNEAVFSIGEVESVNDPRCRVWKYKSKDCYRKIISLKGQIIGAQSIGDWPESRRIAELCRQSTKVSMWQLLRFKLTGSLLGNQANKVANWPSDAIVCQCMSVSKERICNALTNGCQTLKDVSQQTGASSVCGSCKPLVAELAADYKPLVIEADEKWKPLLQTSLFTLILSFIFLILPGVSYSLSVQEGQFEQLWIDSTFKQISGYSLLTLSVLIGMLSVRKRIEKITWLKYSTWRFFHTALGVVLLMVLITHTGLHLGSNLNFALMLSYLLVCLAGTVAGLAVALEHKSKPQMAAVMRKFSFWGHVLTSWPLPTLLAFHILSVYYF